MTQQTKHVPRPQVLISNPVRCKFNFRKTNSETAPASDPSLAGAVLYVGEVMRQCMFWKSCGETRFSMLGHFDAGFTLRTYTHVTTKMQEQAADTMGQFIAQNM